jgi:hypothetical protein
MAEEIKTIEDIKGHFVKALAEYTMRCRDVRFSELLYDESLDVLVTSIEQFANHPVCANLLKDIRRIYLWRV